MYDIIMQRNFEFDGVRKANSAKYVIDMAVMHYKPLHLLHPASVNRL